MALFSLPSGGDRIPSVAIVGRPNVGKSALFNALLNTRVSIVHEAEGVTRDRVVAPVIRNGRTFQLVDTGGLGMLKGELKSDFWNDGIRRQVETAIEEADVIVMVIDVQKGIIPLDREVALRLHESGKPVILAATKADNPALADSALRQKEYTALGFGTPIPVSSLHRIRIDELMNAVVGTLGVENMVPLSETEPIRIAIVGRPNVGKSSLVNRLLGQERVMVSPIAGTTRDLVNTPFKLNFRQEDHPALLIDTAGLRKKAKVDDIIEHFSNMRVESAVRNADLVLFVTEADAMGATAQDKRIARLVQDEHKACVVVVNKWDLCKDAKMAAVSESFRATLPHFAFAPICFVCAKSGYNFNALLDRIGTVLESLETQITTGLLNRTLEGILARTPPPVYNGTRLKIYYATMTGQRPPCFTLFANKADACAPNYAAYLNRSLREAFGFNGVPVQLVLKDRPKTIASIRTKTVVPRGKVAKKTLTERENKARAMHRDEEGGKGSKRLQQVKTSRIARVRKSVTARQKTSRKKSTR